ncbi:MAG: AmmeMemoRadiSam system protein A [Candidatus Delongbacteria bacterium]|nr:AmmeMemoRadiSam system protein A [Candidatus Delongbacteria bacterium]
MEIRAKEYLLKLAREAVALKLKGKDIKDLLDLSEIPSELLNEGAAFVTLTKAGELRGCIGSLEAYRPLYLDVISHSLNAAFRDQRFYPVSMTELALIKIEISVLAERTDVSYTDFSDLKKKIIPGVHGVYLTYKDRSATFLPQVWDQLPDHEQFFGHLCNKAGLQYDLLLTEKAGIEIYTVENFEEK